MPVLQVDEFLMFPGTGGVMSEMGTHGALHSKSNCHPTAGGTGRSIAIACEGQNIPLSYYYLPPERHWTVIRNKKKKTRGNLEILQICENQRKAHQLITMNERRIKREIRK